MAGLPWIITFLLLALLAMNRGWGWLAVLSLFCMGVGAADTAAGAAIYNGVTGLLAGAWAGLLSMLNSVAG